MGTGLSAQIAIGQLHSRYLFQGRADQHELGLNLPIAFTCIPDVKADSLGQASEPQASARLLLLLAKHAQA